MPAEPIPVRGDEPIAELPDDVEPRQPPENRQPPGERTVGSLVGSGHRFATREPSSVSQQMGTAFPVGGQSLAVRGGELRERNELDVGPVLHDPDRRPGAEPTIVVVDQPIAAHLFLDLAVQEPTGDAIAVQTMGDQPLALLGPGDGL